MRYHNYVLVRNSDIVISGTELECYNFAQRFGDDKWAVMTYDEYNYFSNHPEELRRGGVMSIIAHNVRSGRVKERMRRPTRRRRY